MLRNAIAGPALRRASICIAAIAICFGGSQSAIGEVREFTMTADAACTGSGSSATGAGTFTLDTDTGEVSFNISVFDLTPVQQHVHGPGDTCIEGFGSPGHVSLPAGTEVSGTYMLDAPLQASMLQGKHWFLSHSLDHVEGEILGQIIPVCPGDCTGNGTCNLGICTCDPSWTGADCSIAVVVPAVSTWGLIIGGLLTLTCACLVIRTRAFRGMRDLPHHAIARI